MPGGLPKPIVNEVLMEDLGVFQRLIFRLLRTTIVWRKASEKYSACSVSELRPHHLCVFSLCSEETFEMKVAIHDDRTARVVR
jgi:hypothetical protein